AGLPREQNKKAQMILSFKAGGKAAFRASILLLAVLTGTFLPKIARAAQAPQTQSGDAQALQDESRQSKIKNLRRALAEESQRTIYRWHDAEHPSPPTWFDKQLEKIGSVLARIWNAVADFFRRLWPRGLTLSPGNNGRGTFPLKDLGMW